MNKPIEIILLPEADRFVDEIEGSARKIFQRLIIKFAIMKATKYTKFEDLEDKYFGEKGTPERNEYELDLKMELIGEKIKQLRIQNNLTQSQLGELKS